MFSVIFRDEVWRLDIGGHLPRVVLSAETLPLNQELEPPLVPAAIQYLLVRATGHEAPGESSVNITVSSYDTTHFQENPQRLG